MEPPPEETASLLDRSRAGDAAASAQLTDELYGQLRGIAERLFARERRDHSLQPTAIVHEAWLRVAGIAAPTDKARFLGLAARAMRNVLVDHARRRRAGKRGGEVGHVALDDVLALYEAQQPDLLALDEALGRLAAHDERCARIVELRFFAGLTLEETGATLELSTTHVHRLWEFARAWLRDFLGEPSN
ncbi:MAG: sigma-70 family RNA polymerase sigma factor [Phycisphaerales bacterium]|nr:sigma-70 family RNA polymerase sigma factor [Phycisphaerales bacterium]